LLAHAAGLRPAISERDGDVGLGRANKRADLVKVESLLVNSGDLDLSEIGGPTGYGQSHPTMKGGERWSGIRAGFIGMAPNGILTAGGRATEPRDTTDSLCIHRAPKTLRRLVTRVTFLPHLFG
jgi:hypothetical protein